MRRGLGEEAPDAHEVALDLEVAEMPHVLEEGELAGRGLANGLLAGQAARQTLDTFGRVRELRQSVRELARGHEPLISLRVTPTTTAPRTGGTRRNAPTAHHTLVPAPEPFALASTQSGHATAAFAAARRNAPARAESVFISRAA
jgi:hypothetical protein